MARRLVFLMAFAAAALSATLAQAQSEWCDRSRAELAALSRSADPRAAQYQAAARQLRGQLAQVQGQIRQLGCGGGLLFFGNNQPPQCNGLQAQARQLQAQLRQAEAGAQSGNETRRRQLAAAIQQNCSGRAEPARQPNFFERLFGIQPQQPAYEGRQPGSLEDELPRQAGEPAPARYGGSRVVCVRTCDGFFFPMPTGSRENAGQMCQALCPATETLVYFMAADGTIERSGNSEGKPYTELPNASRYKRSYDPACSCRKPGETWAQALRGAEELLKPRSGDIIVTAEKAEELSRPRIEAKAETRTAKGKPKPVEVDPDAEPPIDAASVPTASGESSGIGPQTIGDARTLGKREGQVRQLVGADGQKQAVRVVAPNIFASPETPTQAQ